jgi:glutathione S-transferase
MSQLKIYGVPLSRAFRALWCANEIGIPYESVPTHFAAGGTRTPEFLAINPNGKLPAIELGGLQALAKTAQDRRLEGLWVRPSCGRTRGSARASRVGCREPAQTFIRGVSRRPHAGGRHRKPGGAATDGASRWSRDRNLDPQGPKLRLSAGEAAGTLIRQAPRQAKSKPRAAA